MYMYLLTCMCLRHVVCISHFATDFVGHLLFEMYFQNQSSVFCIYQTFISWHYLACLLCNVQNQAYYRLVQCQYQGLHLESMLIVWTYKKLHCLVLKTLLLIYLTLLIAYRWNDDHSQHFYRLVEPCLSLCIHDCNTVLYPSKPVEYFRACWMGFCKGDSNLLSCD